MLANPPSDQGPSLVIIVVKIIVGVTEINIKGRVRKFGPALEVIVRSAVGPAKPPFISSRAT